MYRQKCTSIINLKKLTLIFINKDLLLGEQNYAEIMNRNKVVDTVLEIPQEFKWRI